MFINPGEWLNFPNWGTTASNLQVAIEQLANELLRFVDDNWGLAWILGILVGVWCLNNFTGRRMP
jgi:hypothetical protein